MTINGIVNLNKRSGISSFKAVREVKNVLEADKAGHTGTLDPNASGVLPVCLGKSTRIVDYLMNSKKEYNVSMFLGICTKTYDLEESISGVQDVSKLTDDDIIKVIESFVGREKQFPPIYSAIKVKGKKLYEYALKGESVEIEPREIEIFYIKKIVITDSEYMGNNVKQVSFTVGCSKGTYIRSLCNDIGKKINNLGVMADLKRTLTGGFKIENSYTIDQIKEAVENNKFSQIVHDIEEILDIPIVQLNDKDYQNYMNGRKVVMTGDFDTEYLVKSCTGQVIGIGIVDINGNLKSKKRLI